MPNRLIDFAGGRFIIRFAYNPALVERVKKLPQRRWAGPQLKYWTVPQVASAQVAAFALRNDFQTTTAAAQYLPHYAERASIALVGDQVEIKTSTANMTYAVRRLPGSKWDKKRQAWTVPIDEMAALAIERFAHEQNISLPAGLREAYDGFMAGLDREFGEPSLFDQVEEEALV